MTTAVLELRIPATGTTTNLSVTAGAETEELLSSRAGK